MLSSEYFLFWYFCARRFAWSPSRFSHHLRRRSLRRPIRSPHFRVPIKAKLCPRSRFYQEELPVVGYGTQDLYTFIPTSFTVPLMAMVFSLNQAISPKR